MTIVDLSRTDWKLLRKQKKRLANLELVVLDHDKEEDQTYFDAIDGVLNWIDDIQDQAAKQLGDKKVFGRKKAS
jgi:hypothetical protein